MLQYLHPLVPKQNHVTFIPFHLGKNWLFFLCNVLLTVTISYVIDSLYMDKKRYPKKRDAQLNSEMHSFLYHTDFGGSDHHRKKHPNLLTRFMYFSAMSAILIV